MVNKNLTKVFVSKIGDLPNQLGKTVLIEDKEIAVFKLSNGNVRAIENRCPHKGGVLAEGMVSGKFVFCPMHDWKISLEDGKVQEPDTGCVQTYETIVEGEDLYIVY
ncbi:nitrite reductase small subunit NirD [Bacillus sp. GM2]|uniref:Nitrite reductase small subunit NirD n=1 Tax=Bacillus paralicheniformis TaxID=1648923 RepID=A0AAW6KA22_9BACI|nr:MULTISPECIES: nitrite reductase small subunit NirD [Bacillus]KUL15485.1 nitrite reductase NAD(P)H small subunit [Bacillus licheniformis LMG 6934]MCJ2147971.1 nitrite reductase small subunit NirD [Bacillus sp. B19-2]MDE1383369.1 nitrite reductase small subunit NirD [Bacillus paralicheniformis]MDE1451551.1 nitrite reductase small subunit NirD [Bacillus paralicheniformis]MDN5387518.1 nitrite reductase small subunit NirD [Bacillus sp. LB7]